MTGRVIVLDRAGGRERAALLVDGQLEDLLLAPRDPRAATPETGAIGWAKVDRLAPSMGAAFLALGPGATGFLRECKGLREGQGVLVQVTGQPEPGKAVPVTRRVLYKGRRLIHTPDRPGINVSRRIGNEAERARLTDIVAAWQPDPAGLREPARATSIEWHRSGGWIVRTAARGASAADIAAEIDELLAARAERTEATHTAKPGAFAPVGTGVIDTALREWTGAPFDRIVWSPRLHGKLAELDDPREPERRASADIVAASTLHDGDDPFEDLGIAEQIDALASPRAPLPSGGWLAVEPTAALVAVDVNTGGDFSAAACLKVNLEAAVELPRQLRLRGLGGQIAVDFAPGPKRDRKRIEQALKAAFGGCPVETAFAGWTPLGMAELSRKRERRSVSF